MDTLPVPQACVLDLDGTLLDTLRDIADAANLCLDLLGQPTQALGPYRLMVGEGVTVLCQRAIGHAAPALVPRMVELLRPIYRAHLARHTCPYPGINELLVGLGARAKLAVLSNKPHEPTCALVRRFWPAGTFQAVYGASEEHLRKPSPYYVARICGELGVDAAAVWVIGDTPIDVKTARAAGACSIGAAWGFRSRAELTAAGADVVVDAPGEILELLRRVSISPGAR